MHTTDLDKEASLIRAARSAQTQAIARGEHDAIVSYWTEDITVRRALGHAVSGIAEALQALTPSGNPPLIYQREATNVEVSPQWPLAFEEGRWSGHPGSIQAAPIISGRYSAQWVKREGKWLIRAEVFVALTCSGAGCEAVVLA